MGKKDKSKSKEKSKSKAKASKSREKLATKKGSKKAKRAAKVQKEKIVPAEPSGFSLLSDFDIHLFREGKHANLYEKMGSHEVEVDGVQGTFFAVWAPNAKRVSVVGNFNFWDGRIHSMRVRGNSGI